MAMDGLRVQPSQSGVVHCLRCPKTFNSPDKTRIRICPNCKREPERVGLIGEMVSRISGIDLTGVDYAASDQEGYEKPYTPVDLVGGAESSQSDQFGSASGSGSKSEGHANTYHRGVKQIKGSAQGPSGN